MAGLSLQADIVRVDFGPTVMHLKYKNCSNQLVMFIVQINYVSNKDLLITIFSYDIFFCLTFGLVKSF